MNTTDSSQTNPGDYPFSGGYVQIKISCPVDVSVYDMTKVAEDGKGSPAASIINDQVVKDGGVLKAVFARMPEKIAAEAVPDQTYTGEPLTPEIVIHDRDKVLAEGRDYHVRYVNNVNAYTALADAAQEETAKSRPCAVVTMTGDYDGVQMIPFNMLPVEISAENGFRADPCAVRYNGKAQQPQIVLRQNGRTLSCGRGVPLRNAAIDRWVSSYSYTGDEIVPAGYQLKIGDTAAVRLCADFRQGL